MAFGLRLVRHFFLSFFLSMSAALTGSLYVGHSMGGIGVCGCTTQPNSAASDCFLCNGISALM
jgi:hypothetical protein